MILFLLKLILILYWTLLMLRTRPFVRQWQDINNCRWNLAMGNPNFRRHLIFRVSKFTISCYSRNLRKLDGRKKLALYSNNWRPKQCPINHVSVVQWLIGASSWHKCGLCFFIDRWPVPSPPGFRTPPPRAISHSCSWSSLRARRAVQGRCGYSCRLARSLESRSWHRTDDCWTCRRTLAARTPPPGSPTDEHPCLQRQIHSSQQSLNPLTPSVAIWVQL